jgi:uncharacterized protein YndB with AHSA1/START domain
VEFRHARAIVRQPPTPRVDPRAGGNSVITMQAPDGTLIPNRGVYLDVVANERIVFTDAYTAAWVPSAKPSSPAS